MDHKSPNAGAPSNEVADEARIEIAPDVDKAVGDDLPVTRKFRLAPRKFNGAAARGFGKKGEPAW